MFFSKRKHKPKLVFEHSDQRYGKVEVVDRGDYRYLQFGNHIKQGAMDRHHPDRVHLQYQQMMIEALEEEVFEHCLCLGLGAGTLPRYLHDNARCNALTVVEVNPVVVDVARRYFQFPKQITVYTTDALEHVEQDSTLYDLILVDLFDKSGAPEKFKRFDFYQLLHQRLLPMGRVVINVWAADFGEILLEEILGKLFDEIRVIKTPGSRNHITLCIRLD